MSSASKNGHPSYDPNGAVADFATIAGTELPHQTQLLRELAGQGKDREYLEDQVTIALSTATAIPYVFCPGVKAVGDIDVEAWQSGAAVPVIVLDGRYPATVLQTVAAGYVNAMLCVPNAGTVRVRRQGFSGTLTIVPLGTPATTCLVTVRVRACENH